MNGHLAAAHLHADLFGQAMAGELGGSARLFGLPEAAATTSRATDAGADAYEAMKARRGWATPPTPALA